MTESDDRQSPNHRYALAEHLVVPVLTGRKEATIRYKDERDVEEGDTITLSTPDGLTVATAEVTHSAKRRVGNHHDGVIAYLKAHDINYPTNTGRGLLETLNEHYEQEIHVWSQVSIIAFEVIDSPLTARYPEDLLEKVDDETVAEWGQRVRRDMYASAAQFGRIRGVLDGSN